MKKLWLIIIPILAVAAGFLAWQNRPAKQYAKHIIKARLYVQENNLTAARLEYEKAFKAKGGYTPFASLEVLRLTTRMSLQERNTLEALNNTRLFVKANPASVDGKMMLAQLAFQLGEVQTAFDALDTLLQADPWNFPARLLLTSVRARQGRLDLAEEQMRFLNAKFPDSLDALLPLAELLVNEGQVTEGRVFLTRALAKNPKNGRANLLLVDSYIHERKVDSALLVLNAWKDADPEREQALQIRKAQLLSMNNRNDSALQVLAPYRDFREVNLQALSEAAILQVIGGQYDSALVIYRGMAEAIPKAKMAAENMSFYLYMKNHNPARALEALKSLEINDKRPTLMMPMVAAYVGIGQEQKAKEFIQQQADSLRKPLQDFMNNLEPDKEFIGEWALLNYYGINHKNYWVFRTIQDMYKGWPKNAMALNQYLGQLASIKAYGEAIKVLSKIDHPSLGYQTTLLQLYVSSNQSEKVLPLANKISAEHPTLRGINTILADYWMKKDKAKGLPYYEKELTLDPDNVVALNDLAWEYGVVQANLAKALPYLEKLKARNRMDPRIMDTVGWILAVNGKDQEGEAFIHNALNMVPDHPIFLYHMGYIMNKAGKKDLARKYLDQALSSKFQFDGRKDAEKLRGEMG